MKILKNSAKCTACGLELESRYVHDFRTHYCKEEPQPGLKWEGDIIVPSGEETFRFFIDGGKDYIRRGGKMDGFIDTSEYEEDASDTNS